MSATLKAGAVYFAIVFSAAFFMGALRTLVVAPRLGETPAVLLEAPVILVVSWHVAKWCVARFEAPTAPISRLPMGGVAFALLMIAELGVSLIVFHRPLDQYLNGLRSTAGVIGLGAQFAFAWIPLALKWHGLRRARA